MRSIITASANYILVFVITFLATAGALWGAIDGITYFTGEKVKQLLGPYWSLVILLIPLLIALLAVLRTRRKEISLACFDLINPRFLRQFRGRRHHSSFFDGSVPTWEDIVNDLDIPRDIARDILATSTQWTNGKLLIPVLASAGEGKSTFLRRLAVELAVRGKVTVFRRRDALRLDSKEVADLARNTKKCVYVLVDDAGQVLNFCEFIRSLADDSYPLVVVAASRPYDWLSLRSELSNSGFEIKLASSGTEYSLDNLSDGEIALLFGKLANEHLIQQVEDEALPRIVEHYSSTIGRSLIVLVLSLTRAEEIKEVIRQEIARIQAMGQQFLVAYRYVCLFASIDSYMPLSVLSGLVSFNNVRLDFINRLPGLVECVGNRVYARHNRIGEIATDILFEGADDERGNALCELIALAFGKGEIEAVSSVPVRAVPESQRLRVLGCVVDQAFCTGQYQLIVDSFDEWVTFSAEPPVAELLAQKTPLLFEMLAFYPKRIRPVGGWQALQGNPANFPWPNCPDNTPVAPDFRGGYDNSRRWAEIYERATFCSEASRMYSVSLQSVVRMIYAVMLELYQAQRADIYYSHAEYLCSPISVADDDEVITLYELALKENPDHAEAHAGLAEMLYFVHRYEEAYRHYKTSRRLNPRAVYHIGKEDSLVEMLTGLGELREAIELQLESSRNLTMALRSMYEILGPEISVDIRLPTEMSGPETRTRTNLVAMAEDERQLEAEDAARILAFIDRLSPEEIRVFGKKVLGEQFGELRNAPTGNLE